MLRFESAKSKIILYIVFLLFCAIYGYSISVTKKGSGIKSTVVAANRAITVNDLQTMSYSRLKALLSQKNKTRLLLVYAAWCRFCREEIAAISGILSAYQDNEDFLPILVSLDQNKDLLLGVLNKHGVSFIPYVADDLLRDSIYFILGNYKINYQGTIPVLAVIDPEGRVYQGSKYRNSNFLRNLIDELLSGSEDSRGAKTPRKAQPKA